MADRYWVPGGTNTWSNTANWSASPTLTPTGASVPTAADNVFFTSVTSYSVNITASANCFNFTASAGTPSITMTAQLSVAGSFDLTGSSTAWVASTSTLFFQATGATVRTVNTAGVTIDCPVTATANVASTLRLLAAMTIGSTRLFTYSAGATGDTLDLNGFTLTCGTFNSANTITRTIAFGSTGKVVVQGTGSNWDTSTITGLTISGTPSIDFTYNGATAMVVRTGALTETMAPSVNFIAGSYALSFGTSSIKNLTTTSNTSAVNFGSVTVYGDLLLSGSTTVPNSGSVITFAGTSGTKTITSNAVIFGNVITFNGVGATWQLQDDLTCQSAGTSHTVTLTNGTLDLNGKILTSAYFSSSNSNTRVIAFGTTGAIKLAGTGVAWTTATSTNFSYTGTSNVTIDNNTATASTITPGTLTEAQALNFNIISGTYALTITNTASFKNLNFVNTGTTGFGGNIVTHTADINIYGNLTLSSNMTSPSSTLGFVFAATSGTQLITSNGKTFDNPLALAGVGGTTKLADAFAMGTTRTFNFNNGTFDGNGMAITGPTTGGLAASSGGVVSVKGLNAPAVKFTHSSSTLTFTGDNTVAAYTFTLGTLNLNGYKLTCTTFNSNNANVRTLAFGSTGTVTCTGSGTGLWDTSGSTNLTVTGTPLVIIQNNSATAATVSSGPYSPAPETQAISFKFTTGTYALTFLGAAGYVAKDVDFTGFGGSWVRTTASTIYGSLTLSSIAGFTLTGATGALTFGATSGTQIITSNGKTFSCALTVDGVGGTTQLADTLATSSGLTLKNGTFDANTKALSLPLGLSIGVGSVVVKNISSSSTTIAQSSGTLTLGTNITVNLYQLTSGTLDIAGFTLTTVSFNTGVGTKNITFNGGTFLVSGSSTPWNNANPTGFTTTAGTGTGKISITSASAKTFAGGGSTYNCTLSNDGAGALTVSGDNTFLGIANGVSPAAFIFTAGSTQTTGSWTVSGTSTSARVTITSTAAGSAANLVKTGGGTVSSNYLSLKDSAATPSLLTWYAGPLTNSVDVSGNSGWIFGGATVNSGAFFLLM